MPEVYFDIALPDGAELRCYSPSLIVTELLRTGEYPLFEFMARSRAALHIASERVRVKYGFTCSAALDQLAMLEQTLAVLSPDAPVRVLGFAHERAGPRASPA